MKRSTVLFLCIGVLCFAASALAGPLDRYVEPRHNQAADSMLRVPGVVGYELHSGLAILQRAGLTPHVKTVRSENKEYRGREGTIVDQTPSGGGVAMLGSSVTVVHYDPNTPEPAQASDQIHSGPHWPAAPHGGWSTSAPAVPGNQSGSGWGVSADSSWGIQYGTEGTWTGPNQSPAQSESPPSTSPQPVPEETAEGPVSSNPNPDPETGGTQAASASSPAANFINPTGENSQSNSIPEITAPPGQEHVQVPSLSSQGKRPALAEQQSSSESPGRSAANAGKRDVHERMGTFVTAASQETGRYRITLTGFTANRQTQDDPLQMDGKGDEIKVLCNLMRTDRAGNLKERLTLTSAEYGDTNRQSASRILAGSASSKGGIVTGDHFPRQSPWTVQGNSSFDRIPLLIWEGELAPGRDVLFISPSVWECDGDPNYITGWEQRWIDHWTTAIRPEFSTIVGQERSSACQTRDSSGIVLRFANRTDRPVGMGQRLGVNIDGSYGLDIGDEFFFPKLLVLEKERIDRLLNTNCGKGNGTVMINFQDTFSGGDGNYTVYLKLERVE